RHAQAAPTGQGEGQAHRLGQVAGDGRGLWRNPERAAAPDLVPALRNRVLGGGDDPEQSVEDRRLAWQLSGASHHERAGSVMEEGRVADSELSAKDHVVLVAGGADGVEAAVGL